ncbi:MAG: pilus assembly protein PilM [Planctomycetales bacterium]|jgi:hypothetical protein|nr:pilus assembly protein PilM [Planctomycetales bacterium]
MSELLAIHWERKQLQVICASTEAGLYGSQGFTLAVPERSEPGWLKEGLRRYGVTAKQAIVSLPREDLILRNLELPDAPEEEIPLLVSFQAASRSTTPLDQLLLDYLPLPRRIGSLQKEVLLASAPRPLVDAMRSALAEANIELISLTVSSFALTELVALEEAALQLPAGHRGLLIHRTQNRLEVVLMGDHQTLMAHVVRPQRNADGQPIAAKAAADVSRILVPAQPWLNHGKLDRIWLLGDDREWPGLDEALRRQWNCPVERLEPHAASRLIGDISKYPDFWQFGHPLGLVLSHCNGKTPAFDLLHPHQTTPQRDPRKWQIAVGSAAALLIAALGTAILQMSLASLDAGIKKERSRDEEHSRILAAGKLSLESVKIIEDWSVRDVNQLTQIGDLYEFMQGTEQLYVSDYKFEAIIGDARAKLNAAGNARNRSDWEQLAQRVSDTKTYHIKPRELTQSNSDPDYPNRFQLEAELIVPSQPQSTKHP